ncbi:MAG: hypothetical protein RR512_09635 [Coprobacillus sp.]
MILKTLKEHKILTAFCIGLLVFVSYFIFIIFFTTVIGKIAYYQYAVSSVFYLVIGIPTLLLGLFLLYGFIKDIIKASSRGSMKEKKNIKDNCFVLTINLFVCLVGFLFTAFGVSSVNTSIQDYAYLDNPISINLYDCRIEYQNEGRYFGGSYHLYGMDVDGNKFDFKIGKSLDEIIPSYNKNIFAVYYLPHSKVVMEIK